MKHGNSSNNGFDNGWVSDRCPTGKRSYLSVKFAKRAKTWMARTGGDRLSVYKCSWCKMWHLGHLPKRVRNGEVSRDEYYGRGEAA